MDQTERIAVIETRVREISGDTKQMLQILKGNGKPGLCTEVALLKQKQGLMWACMGSVGTGVIGVIGYLIKGALT